jgi:hypothetical protein
VPVDRIWAETSSSAVALVLKEREEEEEVVNEVAKKKKHSRDGEYAVPWPADGLSMDSQANYQPRQITLLIRSLQNTEFERRCNYFVEVRSNRRRKQVDPATTRSKVFITADEYHLLNYKIAIGRIAALL